MVINVHAGHNADGYTATGAVGYVKESVEDRLIKDAVIKYLQQDGNTVYDCTVDNAPSQNANLSGIVSKCNAHHVDLDVSIHLNAGAADKDEHTTGSEVYVYNKTGSSYPAAQRICDKLASLGYCNRGVKVNQSLYVLRKTNAQALLVECFFVDDKNDVDVYHQLGADKIGKAIAEGIVGHLINEPAPAQNAITYTVKKGDSLWKIAQEQLDNGARYKEIVNANGLINNTIHPGDKLIMPN